MMTQEQAILLDLWDKIRGEPEPPEAEFTAEEGLKMYLKENALIDEEGNPLPEPETKFVNLDGTGSVLTWDVPRVLQMYAKENNEAVEYLLAMLNMVLQMYLLSVSVGNGEQGRDLLAHTDRWLKAQDRPDLFDDDDEDDE